MAAEQLIDAGNQYYILATEVPVAERTLVLKRDDTFGVFNDFGDVDAEARYGIVYRPVPDHKACECGAILRGVRRPTDCKVFGTVCTPDNPIGSCMVSSEGACAAHYTYARFKPMAEATP